GFEKTFSGLMKIIYPHGAVTPEEVEELFAFAMETRRRVREHILRIDDTFKRNDFKYRRLRDNKSVTVSTPEELQYPEFANSPLVAGQQPASEERPAVTAATEATGEPLKATTAPVVQKAPKAGHIVVAENSRGWNFERLFAQYLIGARKIVIHDPYIRLFYQTRNLMELLELIFRLTPDGDEVEVHLVTQSDQEACIKQEENLNQIVAAFTGSRVAFTWELDSSLGFHARNITTDTGWKITLDRGLDIYQRYESGAFTLEHALQEMRLTRGFEVTYIESK
ncbi:MAG: ATP-dependent Lon protease, partial [Fibrobacteres bacterium]|nr:ATP-dependent Lon protease [Fibrobacterota bacterium]